MLSDFHPRLPLFWLFARALSNRGRQRNEFPHAGNIEWPQQPLFCRPNGLNDDLGPARRAHAFEEIVGFGAAVAEEHMATEMQRRLLLEPAFLVRDDYAILRMGLVLGDFVIRHVFGDIREVAYKGQELAAVAA